MADPTKINIPPSFPVVPKRPDAAGSTPGPAWPKNTPCENPQHIGDEPYRAPRPAKPNTHQ